MHCTVSDKYGTSKQKTGQYGIYYDINIIGDELLLNFGVKFQR